MIRITGGEFRGRKIKSPHGKNSRPTLDTVREALFNILGNNLEGMRFVDLYAGVGLVGIEALSRGAKESIFVEQELSLVKILRENLTLLGLSNRAKVFHGSAPRLVLRFLKKSADIIFLDPPYGTDDAAIVLTKLGWSELPKGIRIILQHHYKDKVWDKIGELSRTSRHRYGETLLSFYAS